MGIVPEMLDAVDALRECAGELEGAVQVVVTRANTDPLAPVVAFDQALEALRVGSSALRRMLDDYKRTIVDLHARTHPRDAAS